MGMLILPFFSPSREELTLGRVRTGEKQDFTFYKKITLPGTRDPNCLLAHLTPHTVTARKWMVALIPNDEV